MVGVSTAIGVTLVSLTDTIAASTAFAPRRDDDDPNHETVGIGTANRRWTPRRLRRVASLGDPTTDHRCRG
jgi:hypothetical protein